MLYLIWRGREERLRDVTEWNTIITWQTHSLLYFLSFSTVTYWVKVSQLQSRTHCLNNNYSPAAKKHNCIEDTLSSILLSVAHYWYPRYSVLALWFVQISAQYSYICVDCVCFRMNRSKRLAVSVYVSFRLILKSTLWLWKPLKTSPPLWPTPATTCWTWAFVLPCGTSSPTQMGTLSKLLLPP